jgi:hypothetical protein
METNMAFEKIELSEYLIKIPNILGRDVCRSFNKSIDKTGDFHNNLVESDLTVLSELVQKYYTLYHNETFPQVDLGEGNSGAYNLELDTIILEHPTDRCFNLGGEGQSHRYLAFTFILSENTSQNYINFPAQEVQNIYGCGDLYVIPPYFTHRFNIKCNENSGFRAISIFLRH